MTAEDNLRVLGAAFCAAALLCLAGCGSGGNSVSAAHPSKPHHTGPKSRAADHPGELPLAEMVAAVSSSKAGPPIEIRFAIPARPEVGQVTDIDIAVVPRAPVPDSVSVSFQVVEGLEIVDGAQLQRVDNLVEGTPIRHVVKVLPKRDGIFAVTAVASFVSASQDATRTFSIPVIAGEGLPEKVARQQ
jgi:hypothetical protein